jgi:aminoglycoside phosphotransferase (APT) family kinase protein
VIREIQDGWDSVVLDVDGEWIFRLPRREEGRSWMRREARLLAELAPALPVPVPRFELVEDTDDVFLVAYRKLPGKPVEDPPVALAAELGGFLAELHTFRPSVELPPHEDLVERFVRDVLPLLDQDERGRAEALFEQRAPAPEPALVHADLGPEHILHDGLRITGVIDWSDACFGDPALDFAWLLNGTNAEFAAALLDAYSGEPDPGLRERAAFYHRIGPWYEVLYGLEHDRRDLVDSGLAGIRSRLP